MHKKLNDTMRLRKTMTLRKNRILTGFTTVVKTGLKLFLLTALLFISKPAFAKDSFYSYLYVGSGNNRVYSIQHEIYTPPYWVNTTPFIRPVLIYRRCCNKHYKKMHTVRRRHLRRVIRHRHNRSCR